MILSEMLSLCSHKPTTHRSVGSHARRDQLLLVQIPNFNVSTQISKSTKQHQIAEIIEVNTIPDTSAEIKDCIAFEIEQRRFGWIVAVRDEEIVGLWRPFDAMHWPFSGCKEQLIVNYHISHLNAAHNSPNGTE